MITGDKGIKLIKSFESFEREAYPDPTGLPTIGWGTTKIYGFKVQLGMQINEPVGDIFFKHDLIVIEKELAELVKVDINQNQFDALVSFQYNTGGLRISTLLKFINDNLAIYEDLFTRWNKARINGRLVTLRGLTRRRRAEYALFMSHG